MLLYELFISVIESIRIIQIISEDTAAVRGDIDRLSLCKTVSEEVVICDVEYNGRRGTRDVHDAVKWAWRSADAATSFDWSTANRRQSLGRWQMTNRDASSIWIRVTTVVHGSCVSLLRALRVWLGCFTRDSTSLSIVTLLHCL